MRLIVKFIAVPVFLLFMNVAEAQKATTGLKGVLTADSLASGNLKDVLTSFFQLSLNNLAGPSKELNFNSNPFALLLKTNPSAAIDTNYSRYKLLRKFNFGFGLKLDSSYRFNGFSSAIKFAIINQRDTATSRLLFRELGNDSLSIEIDSLQHRLNEHLDTAFEDNPALKRKYSDLMDTLFTDTIKTFNKLDTAFQRMVKNVAQKNKLGRFLSLITANPKVNIRKESQVKFADLKKELQKKLLWTVSLADTTYKDQFAFSNILLKTEILQGLGKLKPGSNWELNIQASMNFRDDTLTKGRDLKRSVFSFEPGFTWVIRSKESEKSFFELKFSGEYRHIFGKLYLNEERDPLTFNGTLRIRVINDLWIPLEFKYDPKKGNVLGFLSAKLNFSTFGNKSR